MNMKKKMKKMPMKGKKSKKMDFASMRDKMYGLKK